MPLLVPFLKEFASWFGAPIIQYLFVGTAGYSAFEFMRLMANFCWSFWSIPIRTDLKNTHLLHGMSHDVKDLLDRILRKHGLNMTILMVLAAALSLILLIFVLGTLVRKIVRIFRKRESSTKKESGSVRASSSFLKHARFRTVSHDLLLSSLLLPRLSERWIKVHYAILVDFYHDHIKVMQEYVRPNQIPPSEVKPCQISAMIKELTYQDIVTYRLRCQEFGMLIPEPIKVWKNRQKGELKSSSFPCTRPAPSAPYSLSKRSSDPSDCLKRSPDHHRLQSTTRVDPFPSSCFFPLIREKRPARTSRERRRQILSILH